MNAVECRLVHISYIYKIYTFSARHLISSLLKSFPIGIFSYERWGSSILSHAHHTDPSACGTLASVGLEPLLCFHNAVGALCQTHWHSLVPSPLVLCCQVCWYWVDKCTGTDLPNQLALGCQAFGFSCPMTLGCQPYRHWVSKSPVLCPIHWHWVAKPIGNGFFQAHWHWVAMSSGFAFPRLPALV